jgi:predicted permease
MSIVQRIANLFGRSKLDQEIEAELRSHIEMRTVDNIAAGMSREEARRDAVLRFGSRAALKERVIAAEVQMFFDSLWRDLHYAARQLRRSPGFAITAILTLALGIGANVVVFGVLNALVLQFGHGPQAERLYEIVQKRQGDDNQSYPDYLDYRRLNNTFSGIAAYRIYMAGMSTGKWAVKSWISQVSGNYFDVLGAKPEWGRLFHASDQHGPNSAPYIVLSDNFWRARFDANPGVVGTTVELNRHVFTIVGVAQPKFHGPDVFIWPDFWMPMVNEQQIEGWNFLTRRVDHSIYLIGKLTPGVAPAQATSNLNAIAAQLAKQYPTADAGMGARLVRPGFMGDMIGDPARAFLFGIMLLAFLVLLAACANLASLFAARTADRGRELAIRLAIGGSRRHLLRQLLTESVTVSLIGGLAGTLFAAVLLRAISGWQPFANLPIRVTVEPDARVWGMALALSIGSGLFFGLLPMRQVWQTSPMEAIKGGASLLAFQRFTARDILLGLQIMLCTLLVTASLVAFQGMQRALHAPLGFEPQGVVLAETDLHMAGYRDTQLLSIQKRIFRDVRRVPGVTAVGSTDEAPLYLGGGDTWQIYRQGTTDFRPANSVFTAQSFVISPGYLRAAGTHLLAGRDLTWNDDAKSPQVALVNETFVRRMFGSVSGIAGRFMDVGGTSHEIAGVVEDGKYASLTERPKPAMFLPLAQNPTSAMTLVIRSHLTPGELAPVLTRVLAGINPNLPFTIQSWPNALAPVLFPARIATVVLGIMGLLAAMLAVTGIFGMAAYSVSRRMKELGIRVALGAQPARLIGAALGRPVILLIAGSAVGLVLGTVASRLLAQIVYEATPRDPLVVGGAVITMIALGLLALWIPARRALRIHPAELLREE